MLSYEQVKAIQNALGPQAAPHIIEVLESIGDRVKTDLSGELATKRDIERLELATKNDMEQLRGEVKAEIEQFRGQVKAEFAQLRGEVKAEIAQLRGEVKAEIEQLRGDFNARMARMEVMMKVLIGLAVVAIAFFSPAVSEIIRLLK